MLKLDSVKLEVTSMENTKLAKLHRGRNLASDRDEKKRVRVAVLEPVVVPSRQICFGLESYLLLGLVVEGSMVTSIARNVVVSNEGQIK